MAEPGRSDPSIAEFLEVGRPADLGGATLITPLSGRTALVTGASAGIGREIARYLAIRQMHVVLACRDSVKGERARAAIEKEASNPRVDLAQVDLSSISQTKAFASRFAESHPRLALLVNNAGTLLPRREVSEDGFERTFAVNALAPFVLTRLLLQCLRSGVPSRVVNVASEAHRYLRVKLDDLQSAKRYTGWAAYARSKAALILLTQEFARRHPEVGVSFYAVHPGIVDTELFRESSRLLRWFFRTFGQTPAQGASTPIYAATEPALQMATGKYYARRRERRPASHASDPERARRLWQECERLAGLEPEMER